MNKIFDIILIVLLLFLMGKMIRNWIKNHQIPDETEEEDNKTKS